MSGSTLPQPSPGGQASHQFRLASLDGQTATSFGRGDIESSLPSRTERQKITLRLPRQIAYKLKVFCAINGLNLQDVVSAAIADLLARELNPQADLDGQTATIRHDDSMTTDDGVETLSSKSSSDPGRPDGDENRETLLLQFYRDKTGNMVKERDRDALREVLHFSDTAIKGGILCSILRCPTKINSLRYCLNAVGEVSDAGISSDIVWILSSKLDKKRAFEAQSNLPGVGATVAQFKAPHGGRD